MARSKPLVKVAVGLVVVAGLGYLFMRSVTSTRSAPYTVPAAQLRGWQLAVEPASPPTAPMLVLRPPQEFSGDLFNQVFARAMESMKGLSVAGVPIVLQGEFELALAGLMPPQALLSLARESGLETASFAPRCVATRRVSEPGSTRQIYFVIFDAPAFTAFRQMLAVRTTSGLFEASALSPVLIVGGTDANFNRWMPVAANPDVDCVAPIVTN